MKNLLKDLDVKILILSRGRYNTIKTVDILPEYIEVLVPESEEQEYRNRINNPILTVPDSIKGLGCLRNWVLDNFPERTVIMLDDDISKCYELTHEKTKNISDKEEVLQILINCYIMADDLGVKCFGFNQSDIRKYNGTEPFSLNSFLGCVIGVIGREHRFRDDKFKVDYDFCLSCMLTDRITFQDSRYYFSQLRDNNTGGNSIFRTQTEFDRSIETLEQKWGKCITVKRDLYNCNVSIRSNVKRKQDIRYE